MKAGWKVSRGPEAGLWKVVARRLGSALGGKPLERLKSRRETNFCLLSASSLSLLLEPRPPLFGVEPRLHTC